LPGLVIDRYSRSYVIRLDTVAWIPSLRHVTKWLTDNRICDRIILRLGRNAARQTKESYGLKDGQILYGKPTEGPVLFQENGLIFSADVIRGQKTGFFFDQRDNRAQVETLIGYDRHLKDLLNVYAYTGAFSIYAARGGVRYTTNIDISGDALDMAKRNILLNQVEDQPPTTEHDMVVGDAFQVLEELGETGKQYDIAIVDPPSFAKRRSEIKAATNAYYQLAMLTIPLVRRGGVLVNASCSSRVSAERFYRSVFRAAKGCGRDLEILAQTDHPLDHPVGFPEGAYLKCLFAFVH
jgi:23S rRNA (cytosine1962-C5)-methyltransferase